MTNMTTTTITADMSLAELFAHHPGAETAFLELAPAFRHLADPVLRQSIGRATTVQRAAKAAGLEPETLVAQLRQRLGQAPESPMLRHLPHAPSACSCTGGCAPAAPVPGSAPAWAAGVTEPDRIIDADEIIAGGESPLGVVAAGAQALAPGEVLGVRVAFRPEPMIQKFEAQGYRTHCRASEAGRFELLITPGDAAST
jgi:hypothetical protein